MLIAGVQSLTLLSSPTSEENIIHSCPHTNVVITCTATQVATLHWYAVPGLRDLGYAFTPSTMASIYLEAGGFTITIVKVNNVTDGRADFTSTLEVMSDDLIDNKTTVTCRADGNQKQLVISKLGTNQI